MEAAAREREKAVGRKAPGRPSGLASTRSDRAVKVVFRNCASERVRVLWADFRGKEVQYFTLKDGESKQVMRGSTSKLKLLNRLKESEVFLSLLFTYFGDLVMQRLLREMAFETRKKGRACYFESQVLKSFYIYFFFKSCVVTFLSPLMVPSGRLLRGSLLGGAFHCQGLHRLHGAAHDRASTRN